VQAIHLAQDVNDLRKQWRLYAVTIPQQSVKIGRSAIAMTVCVMIVRVIVRVIVRLASGIFPTDPGRAIGTDLALPDRDS
jgi:hypothetical protein